MIYLDRVALLSNVGCLSLPACFDYFRSRCELNVSIEENKSILKEKMKEAQTAGEKANQSR